MNPPYPLQSLSKYSAIIIEFQRKYYQRENMSFENEMDSESEREPQHSINSSQLKEDDDKLDNELQQSGNEFIIKEDGFEDIKKSSTLFNQVRVSEFISLYFSMTAVALSVIAYEKDYYNLLNDMPNDHIDSINVSIIMWVAFVFNIMLFISIILRHYIYFKWLHSKKMVTQYDTLRNTGQWKIIVKEILVCMIMPYPFLNTLTYTETWVKGDTYVIKFKWNYILFSFMTFTRIYQIIKCTLLMTYWLSPRAQRVCHMSGCKADYMFAVKSLMKAQPYTVLVISLIVSVGQMGYCLRIFERPLSKPSGQDFGLMSNTIWNVLVTMTTVGYGDYFPKTNMGRIIGLIIAFWGVFIVSLFVVSLSNMFEFDGGELKAFTLNERLQAKEDLRVEASNVLSSAYRQRQVIQKNPNDRAQILSAFRNFRKYMVRFQSIARQIRAFSQHESEVKVLGKEIEELMENIMKLQEDQKELQELFKSFKKKTENMTFRSIQSSQ
ncbi:small-conductance calcium-activated potassium channel protein [Stylonychia lemnae]|uniref:Small-conductance calcium-activated potassium channel protein n=1 Tax=Stylonychia lemnae TaxID=5949 RepID=A0A078B2X2_STYLE|nr:small-conductance calcium-activated potassium channel protein [Stylonychia lemnae]|eukprot:CDW88591.1 small-conductance calcium-activated potassium channel protein [Stylonychia lemnae]